MILGLQNRLDFLFIARPSVKRADDLKGKKVVIGTPSGSAALATFVALDHLGLVPKRDNVVLLQLGDVPERVTALRAGNVEAASLSPELGPLLSAEGYRVLLDIGKENIPFQSAGLVIARGATGSRLALQQRVIARSRPHRRLLVAAQNESAWLKKHAVLARFSSRGEA